MSEENETVAVITCQATLSSAQLQVAQIQTTQATLASTQLQTAQIQTNQDQMQAVSASQQAIVPQASPQQVQQQGLSQNNMAQVMSQAPQTAPSPHGVPNSMPPQSPQQYYVHTSVGTGMQGPPAIAPAPGPQTTTTTTVSALHQPLMHHLAPQSLTHPGVSPSPMPQFSPQVQVIQGGIPGTPYLQQVYQNAQGQLIMPSNLTIQPATGMSATPLQQSALNPINSSIQVIASKPFQGQIAPHMIAGGKTGVLQQGQTGYNHPSIPTSVSQTVLIGQLGGQLGVISSQPPNILPAHSTAPKPGDVHKVNNMQAATFGPLQPGITWAAPGTLHSPTLLTQNQPIFIRGAQPGQENVFIQSAQAQPMAPSNSMVPSIASMTAGPQQAKTRSGLEVQANIQPKVPSMRPPILPSMSGGQIRPGSSVSTQTAAGQPIAPAQMVTPRSQGKVRGKNTNSRTSPATGPQQPQQPPQHPCPQPAQHPCHQPAQQQPQPQPQPQQQQQQQQQQPSQQVTQGAVVIQQAGATPISITVAPSTLVGAAVVSTAATAIIPVTPACTTAAGTQQPQQKVGVQPTPMEAITTLAQNRQITPITPPMAPIQPAPHPPSGVRMPLSKGSTPTTTTTITTAVTPTPPATSAVLASPTPAAPVDAAVATPVRPPTSLVTSTTTAPSTAFPLTPPGDATGAAAVPPTKPAQALSAPLPTPPAEIHEGPGSDAQGAKGEPQREGSPAKAPMPSVPHVSMGIGNMPAAENSSLDSSNTGTNSAPPDTIKEEKKPIPNGNCHPNEKTVTTPSSTHSSTGPPKAMVKPQVLTHVIEGFVIHEASEPFPVNRSSILNDLTKVRTSNMNNTATVLPQGTHISADKEGLSEDETKKEMTKEVVRCEVCGKTDLRTKYKKSKRFCSTSCAKRFNVGCSKRINLYKSSEESPSKKLKGVESEGEFERKDPQQEDMDTELQSRSFEGEVPEDSDLTRTPKVDILKWTVRDVVEFIKNLPGCQDYAEDFELQEIDGQALMLLKADHLMSAMSIKLGPALKICAKIEAMRSDRKEN